MYDKYLVTGATGFLGRAVAERLVRRRAQVYALVLQNDPYINLLPKEVHTVIGDVCAKNSLADFFADADSRTCVIHCAGIVSVASRPGPRLYQVNVGGTGQLLQTRIAEGSRPAPCLPSDGSTAPNSSQSRLRSTQKVMHPLNGASFADKGSFCCSESKASRSSARRHMSRYSGRDAGQLTSAPASIFALC